MVRRLPASTLFPYTTLFRSTESHDLSGTVSHEALTTLPLVGRQRGDGGIYSFATLSTGVAAVPSSSTPIIGRSEEHTSELQSRLQLVCRLLLEKKKSKNILN